jgi:SAM-dependent methyltransferase
VEEYICRANEPTFWSIAVKQIVTVASSVVLVCMAFTVSAQTAEQRAQCERVYSPYSGQSGKDVIWVPTPDHVVSSMLKIANTTSRDIVYDLGAGDGKIAIAAAKDFGARAVGIEYNEKMVQLAECLVRVARVGDKAKVIHGDIFETDFSEATVVTMYLLPELNLRLMPTLLKMRPGTRIVSHSFSMGEWQPDERIVLDGPDYIYAWWVPAQVSGNWTLQAPDRTPLVMRLEQSYQKVSGVILEGEALATIQEGVLRGEEITVRYNGVSGPTTLKGSVTLNKIHATVSNDKGSAAFVGAR